MKALAVADDVCARVTITVVFLLCGRDYIGLHDTSKAVASKRESVLGDNGELHTFVNPSRVRQLILSRIIVHTYLCVL